MPPAPLPHTLVLADGSLSGLVALAHAREAAALTSAAGQQTPSRVAVVAFTLKGIAGEAVRRQCESLGVVCVPFTLPALPAGTPAALAEAHRLLHAAAIAAANGCERVIWPESAALGDHLELDRIAAIVDRALLVGRLVALDSRSHGMPGFRIETPHADFTDRQIADLAVDIGVPVETCWWWDASAAEPERQRWLTALHQVGHRV